LYNLYVGIAGPELSTEISMNRALLVAFHFPPIQVSSGVQRTLAHTRYLPERGWEPLVLTAHPRAYQIKHDDQLRDIPDDTIVARAFALDSARHLAIAGRYLDTLALPDRWCSWLLGGVFRGLRMIRRYRPSVIWSTYPIATAHLIALVLHRLTGLPWVADFRDSMTEEGYPREGMRRKVFVWIERRTLRACSKAVFTTPGAIQMYAERYPEIPNDHWVQIPNGYNEAIFADVEADLESRENPVNHSQRRTLVHSGVIYPSERDPEPFFQALSALKKNGVIDAGNLQVILRSTGHEELFTPMLTKYDIQDIVTLAPGVGYRDALREVMAADGLLVLQAANCNHQIPAKIYEYFRSRRPIFAMTDKDGDTARTLLDAGIDAIAPLDDADAISRRLGEFLEQLRDGTAPKASEDAIRESSREYASEVLAGIFAQLNKTTPQVSSLPG
jgi:hypothetical protein